MANSDSSGYLASFLVQARARWPVIDCLSILSKLGMGHCLVKRLSKTGQKVSGQEASQVSAAIG